MARGGIGDGGFWFGVPGGTWVEGTRIENGELVSSRGEPFTGNCDVESATAETGGDDDRRLSEG